MDNEFEKFGVKLVGESGCDDKIYELDKFSGEEFFHENGALRVIVEEVWVDWVLFETYNYSENKNERTYEIIGHGGGTYGSLREPRHTYLGEDGYLFYVNPNLLNWCFQKLSKWFDYDGGI